MTILLRLPLVKNWGSRLQPQPSFCKKPLKIEIVTGDLTLALARTGIISTFCQTLFLLHNSSAVRRKMAGPRLEVAKVTTVPSLPQLLKKQNLIPVFVVWRICVFPCRCNVILWRTWLLRQIRSRNQLLARFPKDSRKSNRNYFIVVIVLNRS
jgi:hypothetical protein